MRKGGGASRPSPNGSVTGGKLLLKKVRFSPCRESLPFKDFHRK
jgi:hypothetical protein